MHINKKAAAFGLAVVLAGAVGIAAMPADAPVVHAAGSQPNVTINSHGKLVGRSSKFTSKEVVIDASDIQYLKSELDTLWRTLT